MEFGHISSFLLDRNDTFQRFDYNIVMIESYQKIVKVLSC